MTEQHALNRIWHAGRTVGRTLYAGDGPDDLIGTMDSRELAAHIVELHNAAVSRMQQCAHRWVPNGASTEWCYRKCERCGALSAVRL